MRPKYVAFYASFFDAIEEVPKKYQADCYRAIINYALNGVEPENLKGIAKAIFIQAKPQIDATNKHRENGAKGAEYGVKGAEYGKLGGRPKKNNPDDITEENPNGGILKTPQKPPEAPPNINIKNNIKKEDKEKDNTSIIPKEKKEQTAEFREALVNFGVETDIADELMLIRKKKKAINTKHAFEMMLAEANKAGITLAEAVKICVDNQWKGFKAEYLQGLRERNNRCGGRGHTWEEMGRIVEAGIALNDILGTRNERERNGETWSTTGR